MITPNPLVSIIVPNYNHSAFLEERLASISNQTYQNFEVILLDDASSDNSRDILDAYAKVESRTTHVEYNKRNTGVPFKQWITGLSLASGDYIWFAESDDSCHEKFLETLVQLLLKGNNIAIAYCHSFKIDKTSQVLGMFDLMSGLFKDNVWENDFVFDGVELTEQFMAARNIIPNASSALFNRLLLEKYIFNYSSLLSRLQDWVLYIDLMSNCQIAFTNKVYNYCRFHPNSVTRSHSLQSYRETIKERLIIFKKIRNLYGTNDIYKSALKNLFKYRNKYKWAENIRLKINENGANKSKVVLYGFNELSKYIIDNNQDYNYISLIIDQSCISDNYNQVPVQKIDNVSLESFDLVCICSIAHEEKMRDELKRVSYSNSIICINNSLDLNRNWI